MSSSCVDAWDSVMNALGIVVPEQAWDDPAAQADIVLAEVAKLQRHRTMMQTTLNDLLSCNLDHPGGSCDHHEKAVAVLEAVRSES